MNRLGAVFAPGRAEVIFADDSSDDTPAAIEMAAATSDLPVLLVRREPAERAGGLGARWSPPCEWRGAGSRS